MSMRLSQLQNKISSVQHFRSSNQFKNTQNCLTWEEDPRRKNSNPQRAEKKIPHLQTISHLISEMGEVQGRENKKQESKSMSKKQNKKCFEMGTEGNQKIKITRVSQGGAHL